jgi:pimeloyl-ACP methyl ester carboxylesterase
MAEQMMKIGLAPIAAFVLVMGYSAAVPGDALVSAGLAATQAPTPTPQFVEIKMQDGLVVQGSFYRTTSSEKAPAVLLLHQNNGSRAEWLPIIPDLVAQGYNVLAIDQRGFGLTGGKREYLLLEKDATAVVGWLRDEQTSVDPELVALIGSSVGANVALRVCASDDRCHAVVALSPGTNYYNIDSTSAVKTLGKKAVLFVAGQLDADSADAVKVLLSDVPRDTSAMARLYAGTASHGRALVGYQDVNSMVLAWLLKYNQKP